MMHRNVMPSHAEVNISSAASDDGEKINITSIKLLKTSYSPWLFIFLIQAHQSLKQHEYDILTLVGQLMFLQDDLHGEMIHTMEDYFTENGFG